ncbi:SCP family extracellular subfamily protein [Besnoitia besnoiti]|uniref:SCP family extracellular subfamily protein n=1 Tax=Besnoitia besnoiti TaxID=94643 RepID=A0A2A9M9N6_BESBE|nr:SCP family extracellular subfamily protein [Besnoitia besnoiti]PFH32383.1 SCP family extracellular subfamily protein [Besnoitia besnoiti]
MAPVFAMPIKVGAAFVAVLLCSSALFGSAASGAELPTDNNAAKASQRTAPEQEQKKAQDLTDACLALHNKYRMENLEVPLPEMKKDESAVELVLKFVEDRAKQGCQKGGHSDANERKGLGENLFLSNDPTCEGAVAAWYNEIQKLNGKYPGTTWDLSIGHFTQMMWEKSTGLACARTTGCTGWNQLFCLYSPPGNYEGEAPFSEAVWKSIKKRDGLSGAMALAPVSTGALAVAAGALLHVLVA